MDSNHRRREPADLQSAPVGHLGILPAETNYRRTTCTDDRPSFRDFSPRPGISRDQIRPAFTAAFVGHRQREHCAEPKFGSKPVLNSDSLALYTPKSSTLRRKSPSQESECRPGWRFPHGAGYALLQPFAVAMFLAIQWTRFVPSWRQHAPKWKGRIQADGGVVARFRVPA